MLHRQQSWEVPLHLQGPLPAEEGTGFLEEVPSQVPALGTQSSEARILSPNLALNSGSEARLALHLPSLRSQWPHRHSLRSSRAHLLCLVPVPGSGRTTGNKAGAVGKEPTSTETEEICN